MIIMIIILFNFLFIGDTNTVKWQQGKQIQAISSTAKFAQFPLSVNSQCQYCIENAMPMLY